MNDLLKILDMSEDEQWEWCVKNVKEKTIGESLADLAFRLRDKAVSKYYNNWCKAKEIVWLHKNTDAQRYVDIVDGLDGADDRIIGRRAIFFSNQAKPIHWIIAALIAKEKAND